MPFKEVTRWVRISSNAGEFKKKIPLQKIQRISVGKYDMCLTRYPDNTVYAFENRCPHQFMEMSKSVCADDKKVICPWHRYAFDLENGKGAGLYLEVFPIKEEENKLYVGFKKTVFSFFK
jgi:nitrite reductase/ring-hydroxylating ferredoxin subunit